MNQLFQSRDKFYSRESRGNKEPDDISQSSSGSIDADGSDDDKSPRARRRSHNKRRHTLTTDKLFRLDAFTRSLRGTCKDFNNLNDTNDLNRIQTEQLLPIMFKRLNELRPIKRKNVENYDGKQNWIKMIVEGKISKAEKKY